ncbi:MULTISPECIES: hypothetical protein [unclassified Acinetobacter]
MEKFHEKINSFPSPKGMKWVCCRTRRVRGNFGKEMLMIMAIKHGAF